MRSLLSIMTILVLFGCNSGGYENKSFKTSEAPIEEDAAVTEASIEAVFNYDDIAQQKIQELADLQLLSVKHPEFRIELYEQIRSFARDTLAVLPASEEIKVELDSLMRSGDLSEEGSFYKQYQVRISQQGRLSYDSIYVIYKTSAITIDGQSTQTVSTQISKSLPE